MLFTSLNPLDLLARKVNSNSNETVKDMKTGSSYNINLDDNNQIIQTVNEEDILLKSNDNSTKSNNDYNIPPLTNAPIKHKEKLTPFEKGIDKIFKFFSNALNIIGPLFTISLTCFICFTFVSIQQYILPYWKVKKGSLFKNFFTIVNIIQISYILINYLLAVIIKPGSVEDIKKSKYYKVNNPYIYDKLSFPPIERHKNPMELQYLWKICKFCKEVKPLRTHHCAICEKCIFKMDHHCPWINNCIGQNNHRYFLLFLFHLHCYSFTTACLSIPMMFMGEFFNQENEFRYICILSIAGFVMLCFFDLWNWFLAFKGYTALEFWGEKSGVLKEVNYDFGTWRKNLFYVFGTKSILSILFLPNIQKLPFSGLEWSRYLDPRFSIDGIQLTETIEV